MGHAQTRAVSRLVVVDMWFCEGKTETRLHKRGEIYWGRKTTIGSCMKVAIEAAQQFQSLRIKETPWTKSQKIHHD